MEVSFRIVLNNMFALLLGPGVQVLHGHYLLVMYSGPKSFELLNLPTHECSYSVCTFHYRCS